ncbi:MAG TPA: c-type cytochrome [Roseovarius sp.]|uniref:c-type cytochrome n=1 Tax=Roseovarius sp. M141 TaxID=2583806 RepID=UPI0020CD39B9|nr:c-type cytochrome [Roseovarius sp. M141]
MGILRYRAATVSVAVMATAFMLIGASAEADSHSMEMSGAMMATGLMMPQMDAAKGRQLFASKGCVVCHSVNGIGGQDARSLDAENMDLPMNPFDFAANMWRGAETMVSLQREELGDVIQISGQELAHIIAFVHDPKEQSQFTGAEIPDDVKEMMEHHETEAEGAHD